MFNRLQIPHPRVHLVLGFLAGLVVKYFMLFHMGTFDMQAYHDWGEKALESGLPNTYHGIYFPFQYEIFELSAWFARQSGSNFVPVFKLSNLLFDAGAFFLLLRLLKRRGSNPAYALLYWLHPWFLSVFSLGYIDFHFAFFVLLSLCFLNGETTQHYLLAGVPLGLAFLMKPQAQILVVAAFLHAVFHYVRRRSWRPFGMLVFPTALFLGYEGFFATSLFPRLGYRATTVLPLSYLNVTNVMPSLNAQLPNIWYPIAYLLKRPGDPIYAVSDQIRLLPYMSAKYLAAALVVALVAFQVFRIERAAEATPSDKFIGVFGFSSLAVPLIMTSAHENHLFLGSVFLVLFLAKPFPLSFRRSGHILLVIQFLNLFGLYGEHPAWIGQFLRNTYSQELGVAYALVSVTCFALMLQSLLSRQSCGRP